MTTAYKLDHLIATHPHKKFFEEDGKMIKLFDHDYSMANILNEALNQARVAEETDLPIPKLLEVTTINGQIAIVNEFIPGKTIRELMTENPANLDQYLNQLVDIQMEIHAKKCPMLNSQFLKFYRKIAESPFDATTRYDLHSRLDAMKRHDKICHGDFNPSNVIIRPDGSYYIIDWSHVTQGNASADVARTYLMLCMRHENDLADKYMDLFCKKSDTAKQYVQKWLPIVAASQYGRSKPDEQEMLAQWINVVDYE